MKKIFFSGVQKCMRRFSFSQLVENDLFLLGIVSAVVLSFVVVSVCLLGGYGLLLDCILFGAVSNWVA